MTSSRCALLAVGVLFAVPVGVRAEEDADPSAVVKKAIAAHGGDKLAKFGAVTMKVKGNVHVGAQSFPVTGEANSFGSDRLKVTIEVEAGGQKFTIINVVTGDKGWSRTGDETKVLEKELLAEAKAMAYRNWLIMIAPLKDKGFTFALIGEVKIEKRAVVGVKVSRKGQNDVDLYFDKETGLLAKMEARVRDEGSGQEVNEETFYTDYKEVQGTKQPMKVTVNRDGKLFIEAEVTGYELAEKLDESVFAKP